jgi:hypothetical protein
MATADKVVKAMSQPSLCLRGRPEDSQESRSALPASIWQGHNGPNRQRPADGHVTDAAKTTNSASAASHRGAT